MTKKQIIYAVLIGLLLFGGVAYARVNNPASASSLMSAGTITDGSIPFGSSGQFAEDNSNLFFDDTNNRLGVGSSTPSSDLSIGTSGASSTISTGKLQFEGEDADGVLRCVILNNAGVFTSATGACQQ